MYTWRLNKLIGQWRNCSLCRIPHSACSLYVTLHYYKVIRGAAAPFRRCVIAQLQVN